jgi:hypothetical protein
MTMLEQFGTLSEQDWKWCAATLEIIFYSLLNWALARKYFQAKAMQKWVKLRYRSISIQPAIPCHSRNTTSIANIAPIP